MSNLHSDVRIVFAEIIVADEILGVDDMDAENSFWKRMSQQVRVNALHERKWVPIWKHHHRGDGVLIHARNKLSVALYKEKFSKSYPLKVAD